MIAGQEGNNHIPDKGVQIQISCLIKREHKNTKIWYLWLGNISLKVFCCAGYGKGGIRKLSSFCTRNNFFMPTASKFCNCPFLWHDFSNNSEILSARDVPPLEPQRVVRGKGLLVFIALKKPQKELDSTLTVTWSLSCHQIGWRSQEKTSEESSQRVREKKRKTLCQTQPKQSLRDGKWGSRGQGQWEGSNCCVPGREGRNTLCTLYTNCPDQPIPTHVTILMKHSYRSCFR